MKAEEFDKKFAEKKDISSYLDGSKTHRPDQEQKRVNVDFPSLMIHQLDREAKRLGRHGDQSLRSGCLSG
jgi:hypothetical protein